jgi:anti-anti-sigma regulatory factor
MVAFETDQPQSLLIVRYVGSVHPDETERGVQEAPAALAKLQSGFRLLADLTDLQSMDVACAPHIEHVMDLCNEKGVSMVVRVIPDPTRDIGMQIMSLFHYGGHVQIVTCETLSEAQEILRSDTR